MTQPRPDPCPQNGPPTYPVFHEGQILTAQDLELLSEYLGDKQRLHNRDLHGFGVVCGLEIAPTDPPSEAIVVRPGHAVDCCGRDITVRDSLRFIPRQTKVMTRGFITIAYGEQPVEAAHPTVDDPDTSMSHRIAEVPVLEVSSEMPRTSGEETDQDEGCPPCVDPRVLLAEIDLNDPDQISASGIDNTVRPLLTKHSTPTDPARRHQLRRCQEVATCAAITGLVAVIAWRLGRTRT